MLFAKILFIIRIFFSLSTLGDSLKHPMLLEPEGQCKEVGKGPVETGV